MFQGAKEKRKRNNTGDEKRNRLRDGKAEPENEFSYKRYPLWENGKVAFGKLLEKEGPKALAATAATVVLSVIQPFAAMALPSAVVYLLGSGWQPGVIFLLLAGYVLALQCLQTARGYVGGVSQKGRFCGRINLGSELFGAVLGADFQKFESREGQQKLEGGRLNLYFGNEQGIEAYIEGYENAMIALLGLVIYSVIVGRMSVWILLLLLLTAGVVMAVHVYADRRTVKYGEEYVRASQRYNYLKREALVPANGKDIRLYRMWDWFREEFDQAKNELVHWVGKQRNCSINAGIFETVISSVKNILVYGYLIYRMYQGEMGLASFLLYVGIVSNFSGRMNALTQAVTGILADNKYMDRYRDFLEFAGNNYFGQEEVAHPGKVHEIRLEHVSFRYEDSEADVIQDLSLTITPGEKIALVGMNGAGKSTLIKLICGLYRPTSGKIYLDGQDVSALSPEEYRKEFAVVFQDVFAFSFSLADNVSCRTEEETDGKRLQQCLQDAGLWERVMQLEKKEQTYMNKDLDAAGVNLSGGELQRLMLARAVYKDSPVVILDEPTAALDPLAESRMYEKYYEMTRDKTSIFISHRLSSTRFCDRILYMEEGRIVEEGNHSQLMERQGAYAAMFHTQAQYYEKQQGSQEEGYAE